MKTAVALGLMLIVVGLAGALRTDSLRADARAKRLEGALAAVAGLSCVLSVGCLQVTLRRQRRRAARGLCVHCGYDLRASTERCPECGTPIGAAPAGWTQPDHSGARRG